MQHKIPIFNLVHSIHEMAKGMQLRRGSIQALKGSQIFPPGYNIYRNDRNMNGGGVLVAVCDNLISSPVTEFQTDCEMV